MHAFQTFICRLNHDKRLQGGDVHDGVVVDLLQALHVVNRMGECHWQVHTIVVLVAKHALNYFFALLNHEVNPVLAFGVVFGFLLFHA